MNQEVEMVKRRRTKYKSDPLLLLVLFAGLAAFMTTISGADNSFLVNPNLADLKDGDVMIAPLGRHGAGVRMYVRSADAVAVPVSGDTGVWQLSESEPALHLSFVMPW